MTWTKIGDVIGSMKPSEWIAKHIFNGRMPEPEHNPTRKHWSELVGSDYSKLRKVLLDWQESGYQGQWEHYTEKRLKTDDQEWLKALLASCREYGWFSPKVEDDTIKFMSVHKIERRLQEDFPREGRSYA